MDQALRKDELTQVSETHRPFIPAAHNYGVSDKPIKKIRIAVFLTTVIAFSLMVFSGFAGGNHWILGAGLLIPLVIVYLIMEKLQSDRVEDFKQRYFNLEMIPWIKKNYGINLHPFDAKKLLDGLAVDAKISDEKCVIFFRKDLNKGEVYLAFADSHEELDKRGDVIDASFPRFNPKFGAIQTVLAENYGIKQVAVDGGDSSAGAYFYSDYDADAGSSDGGGDGGGSDGGGGGGGGD